MSATRIVRPSTAFSLTTGQKRPREKAEGHLNFIRELPCLICHMPAEAAHIRYGDLNRGKRSTGAAEKPSDKYAVPLCPDHHRLGDHSQHVTGDERGWWEARAINPIIISALLWQVTGDLAAGAMICTHADIICGGPT